MSGEAGDGPGPAPGELQGPVLQAPGLAGNPGNTAQGVQPARGSADFLQACYLWHGRLLEDFHHCIASVIPVILLLFALLLPDRHSCGRCSPQEGTPSLSQCQKISHKVRSRALHSLAGTLSGATL
jgi:hypothetical protein